MQICRVGAHRRRVRTGRTLLVLIGAAVLVANATVAGLQPALADPADQPPNVVRSPPDVAQAQIKAWSPPDGSEAVADFSPAVVPDNLRGLAIVVRQGAPVSGSAPPVSG